MSTDKKAIIGLSIFVVVFFIMIICISGVEGLLFVLEVTSGLAAFFLFVFSFEYWRNNRNK